MNKFVLTAISLLPIFAPNAAYAENAAALMPELGQMVYRDIDAVPPGWKLYDKVTGDLNGDGNADSVLIIQKNDLAHMMSNPDGLGVDNYDSNPRAVLVLFLHDGGWKLVSSDSAIIPDHDSPTNSDPYSNAYISGGKLYLDIEFFASAGSWTMSSRTFQYCWNGDAMALIGYDYHKVQRNSGEITSVSINFLTHKRLDKQGQMEDGQETEQWSAMPRSQSYELGTTGNAFDFEP